MNLETMQAVGRAFAAFQEVLRLSEDTTPGERHDFAYGFCNGWLFADMPSLGFCVAQKEGHYLNANTRCELIDSMKQCDAALAEPLCFPGVHVSDLEATKAQVRGCRTF